MVTKKRRHYETAGPPPSTFSQVMSVDSVHGLLEFGAGSFVLKKTIFPLRLFRSGCKEATSPDGGSNAIHIQLVDRRGLAAGPAEVLG